MKDWKKEAIDHGIYHTVPGFVDHIYFKEMSQLLLSAQFSWYYNDNISHSDEPGTLGGYGYTHWFYQPDQGWTQSPYCAFFKPLFLKIQSFLEAKKIIRARADMVTRMGDKEKILPSHIDFNYDHVATLLVINETDGDTVWFKDEAGKQEIARKSPEPNTLVLFSGNVCHTGCLPIKHNQRILMNSNYLL